MRFLSADIIFPIHTDPIPNGILAVSPTGAIKELMLPDDPGRPAENRIERFKGILCPGFVNAHCHLELSHMKGVVPEHTGLPEFITQIVTRREENADEKADKIRSADEEMWRNGIQAVGDICNTTDTIETKSKSRIAYHSFVEVFSFDPSRANDVLEEGVRVACEYQDAGLAATIVPHAPYSVSEQLFAGIDRQQSHFPGPISIHNQETESENEMFISATGALVETFKGFGVDFSNFNPGKKSSLDYALPLLTRDQNVLFIHNTCSTKEEMESTHITRNDVFWCTCPSANRYIENRIPRIPMWLESKANICVGTDSLASNHGLSILDELKLIQSYYPEIPLAALLKMATLTGAKALNMQQNLGSFRPGKQPGITLIKKVELKEGRLTADSSVQRII